jgi:hypothetical protein
MPSNGSFWYGPYGFLYKKNTGTGARKSTRMGAGGGVTCNTPQYLYNKYTPGQNGVGAQSTAVRRAKNHRAVICGGVSGVNPNYSCGQFYNYLGMYDHYLYNPNGYVNPLANTNPQKSTFGIVFN